MSIQSEGGKARAALLSSEERRDIAKRAASVRWGNKSSEVVANAERANKAMGEKKISVPPPIDTNHTKTDQLFDSKKPGYYIFEKEIIHKPCWYCGKSFETRLQLNKFCCPDHKERWLIASLRRGQ